MILEPVTNERAATMQKGDTVVSPFSVTPYMPLRVSEVQSSPTGRVMVRIGTLVGTAQLSGSWSPATAFWFPPAGCKWSPRRAQWMSADGVVWVRPTLADLGIARGEDGFLP